MINLYKLCDPKTNVIYYIGQTDNPEKRLIHHCSDYVTNNFFLYEWISSLKKKDLKPKMIVLEKTRNKAMADKRECQLIEMYWDEGCPLLNIKKRNCNLRSIKERFRLFNS